MGVAGKSRPITFIIRARSIARPLQLDMKVIVSLRNPVERAFSQWKHASRKGQEPLEFIGRLSAMKNWDLERAARNAYLARKPIRPSTRKGFQLSRASRCSLLSTRTSAPILSPYSIACSISLACEEIPSEEQKRNVGSYSRKLNFRRARIRIGHFTRKISRT